MTYKFPTRKLHGKEYVDVNERVKYFRNETLDFKGWAIETEWLLLHHEGKILDQVACMAKVYNEERELISTGTAYEDKFNPKSMVNETSHVENCETSAIGRALGWLGIGIENSIASADEVENAIAMREAKKVKIAQFLELYKKSKGIPTEQILKWSNQATIQKLDEAMEKLLNEKKGDDKPKEVKDVKFAPGE